MAIDDRSGNNPGGRAGTANPLRSNGLEVEKTDSNLSYPRFSQQPPRCPAGKSFEGERGHADGRKALKSDSSFILCLTPFTLIPCFHTAPSPSSWSPPGT